MQVWRSFVSFDGLAEADGKLLGGIGSDSLGRIRQEGIGDPHIHHFVNEFLRIQDAGIYHYGKSFFVTDDFHHIFQ